MKYTKEEKITLAKEYLKTGKLDPPPSCKGRWARDHFNSHIREWAKMLSKYGESYFDRHYRQHTLAEKLEVVTYAEKNGREAAAVQYGIQKSTVDEWLHKFRTLGFDGLKSKPKGRPPKMEGKEISKTPPKTPEGDAGELEKALAKIAELEAKLLAAEKQLSDDRVRIDYLKKLQALTEKQDPRKKR